MSSPLQAVRVTLAPDQLSHLKLKAARRHLSMSAIVRELIEQDRERERRAERARKRNEAK
jgi:hypothetical protein